MTSVVVEDLPVEGPVATTMPWDGARKAPPLLFWESDPFGNPLVAVVATPKFVLRRCRTPADLLLQHPTRSKPQASLHEVSSVELPLEENEEKEEGRLCLAF